ncbi:MAG: class I tRNA ligase family protein, partial [Bacteroidota bacterium]
MSYNFRDIENRWQEYWAENKTFAVQNPSSFERNEMPKYYVLDMFPYPSGAGLHVGHPLGYIASDIVSRYKRLKGFNVLHPMGYDSFGLPTEQYAIQTGQHPFITTEKNIQRYRKQMDKMGFSFDWNREVCTCDPKYYKWTQWIFLKLFNSWYNPEANKSEPIETLIKKFHTSNFKFQFVGKEKSWNELNEKEKSDVLMNYRLAYLSEAWVNWCPQLGTVLANEEVKDGISERGGYHVERKLMSQWCLRITVYAERLLSDLEKINWSESVKEVQRNWIGRSEGCMIEFKIQNSKFKTEVFTTRPDTLFGVTFMTLAPENELIKKITTPEYKQQVETYIDIAKNHSERERQADVKNITGQFTGAYAIHPFTGQKLPIWIGEYVLAGYGTGAVMGVPAHDTRDFAFAKYFGLEIKKVIQSNSLSSLEKEQACEDECLDTYDGFAINSDFINGLQVKDAIKKMISEIEKRGLGKRKIQYRLRDAIFGRQRYWGEPIPIYYKDGIPYTIDESELPLILPEVDKYLPTETGEPPLARASSSWKYKNKYEYEKTTMPGWAGSSWYYLRYMDAHNEKEFVSKDAVNYWQNVDLYIGGNEHATGHLLYVRFWTKFLYDLGYIPFDEPAKNLINQGMILGESRFIHQLTIKEPIIYLHGIFLSDDVVSQYNNGKIDFSTLKDLISKSITSKGNILPLSAMFDKNYEENQISFSKKRIPIEFVKDGILNIESYDSQGEFYRFTTNASGQMVTFSEPEKMSKSKLNVVIPDDIIEKFGADTLRLYEMFLGPLEQSKPWNTNGIIGVFNFLNKFWRLFHLTSPLSNGRGEEGEKFFISNDEPTKVELKILHKTIKKIQEDIENYSFNTSVSAFMICVNELTELKCNKQAILQPLVILLSSFAPHIAEEIWKKLGHKKSISFAEFPKY